ncbi:MAG: hypothetical protein IT457_17910 [Planctomycetes bacterium]|nr:hypothetical protein [Planctomycetota bacterium]
MIRLTRDRDPDAVPAAFVGAARTKNEKRLVDQLPTTQFEFDGEIWKKAKPQLSNESADKCAYCESSTRVVAHGDVEHFRPKSVYWWLAYCLDNYSFACQICNQVHKRDQFGVDAIAMAPPANPSAGSLAPDPLDRDAVDTFLALCKAEKPRFVDPYVENAELFFAWRADDVLREVEMLPRNKSGAKRKRALATIDGLGLNREELRKVRYESYRPLALLASLYDKLHESDRPELCIAIGSLLEPSMPYAAMRRWFVHEVWALPVP